MNRVGCLLMRLVAKLDFDKAYAPYIDQSHNFPFLILPMSQTEEASVIQNDLNSVMTTHAARWITSGGVEEEWDSYMKELNNAGLERYLEIYQQAYDARK